MKKRISILLTFVLFINLFSFNSIAETKSDISAKSAIVIEAKTGKVLHSKNENTKVSIASTTKILTTLICLESGNLDEQFVVDPDAIKVEGSSMGLKEGDIVTKRILCYGMLLPSGNDAANATAVKIAGSIEEFSKLMNKRAQEIGMKNSYFVTPSGLEGTLKGEVAGSTAYDMALLTREALKNPDFVAICSQSSAKLQYGNPPYDRWLKNSNKLLTSFDGTIGVKTGFTDEAGRCLVSACQRNGVTLICITLNDPNDWNNHKNLYNKYFPQVTNTALTTPDEQLRIPLVGGFEDCVDVSMTRTPSVPLISSDVKNVKRIVSMKPFIYAPTYEGMVVGSVDYYLKDELIESIPLVVCEKFDENYIEQNKTLFQKIKEFIFNVIK